MRWCNVCAVIVAVAVFGGCSGESSEQSAAEPSSGTTEPGAATPTSTPAPSTSALAVKSTLDGLDVLPHRIKWSVTATGPIEAVDFMIDDQVAWTEHEAPYVYADDGGYLVTSGLTPGPHDFEVRASASDGTTAVDTVTATVPAPPAVPAELAGTWHRLVANTSAAPAGGSPGNPTDTLTPQGIYSLTFDPRWIHDEFPCTSKPCRYDGNTGAGAEFKTDWVPGLRTFQARGSVTYRNNEDTARLSGWWCENNGPDATYLWSVSGNTLTLQPVGGHDACGVRGFIWTGQWTRSK